VGDSFLARGLSDGDVRGGIVWDCADVRGSCEAEVCGILLILYDGPASRHDRSLSGLSCSTKVNSKTTFDVSVKDSFLCPS